MDEPGPWGPRPGIDRGSAPRTIFKGIPKCLLGQGVYTRDPRQVFNKICGNTFAQHVVPERIFGFRFVFGYQDLIFALATFFKCFFNMQLIRATQIRSGITFCTKLLPMNFPENMSARLGSKSADQALLPGLAR